MFKNQQKQEDYEYYELQDLPPINQAQAKLKKAKTLKILIESTESALKDGQKLFRQANKPQNRKQLIESKQKIVEVLQPTIYVESLIRHDQYPNQNYDSSFIAKQIKHLQNQRKFEEVSAQYIQKNKQAHTQLGTQSEGSSPNFICSCRNLLITVIVAIAIAISRAIPNLF